MHILATLVTIKNLILKRHYSNISLVLCYSGIRHSTTFLCCSTLERKVCVEVTEKKVLQNTVYLRLPLPVWLCQWLHRKGPLSWGRSIILVTSSF